VVTSTYSSPYSSITLTSTSSSFHATFQMIVSQLSATADGLGLHDPTTTGLITSGLSLYPFPDPAVSGQVASDCNAGLNLVPFNTTILYFACAGAGSLTMVCYGTMASYSNLNTSISINVVNPLNFSE